MYNEWQNIEDNKVLFNYLSRASLKLDDEHYRLVKACLDNPNNPPEGCELYVKTLHDNGFLLDSTIDEFNQLEFLYYKKYFSNQSLSLSLIPTYSCNFSCPYCFESGNEIIVAENPQYFEILKRFISNESLGFQSLYLSMFGGEPLLRVSQFFNFFDYCFNLEQKKKIKVFIMSITTNGYLLSDDIIKDLFSRYKCKSLQVTIDGTKENHNRTRALANDSSGTFDRIKDNFCKSIEYCQKNKLKVDFRLRINMAGTPFEEIIKMLDGFEKKYRCNIFLIPRPVFSTNCFLSDFTQYYSNTKFCDFYSIVEDMGFKLQKSTHFLQHCEAGGGNSFFYVSPDLSLWKCIINRTNHEACVGRIDESGKIVLDYKKLGVWFNSNPFKDDICSQCKKLPLCFGGCQIKKVINHKRNCMPDFQGLYSYLYR